ncbi:hypothetical protein L7F22_055402 [Adiantum nelumboides]|nr:hypothetical protein [Adiantum nelumboides]
MGRGGFSICPLEREGCELTQTDRRRCTSLLPEANHITCDAKGQKRSSKSSLAGWKNVAVVLWRHRRPRLVDRALLFLGGDGGLRGSGISKVGPFGVSHDDDDDDDGDSVLRLQSVIDAPGAFISGKFAFITSARTDGVGIDASSQSLNELRKKLDDGSPSSKSASSILP